MGVVAALLKRFGVAAERCTVTGPRVAAVLAQRAEGYSVTPD